MYVTLTYENNIHVTLCEIMQHPLRVGCYEISHGIGHLQRCTSPHI